MALELLGNVASYHNDGGAVSLVVAKTMDMENEKSPEHFFLRFYREKWTWGMSRMKTLGCCAVWLGTGHCSWRGPWRQSSTLRWHLVGGLERFSVTSVGSRYVLRCGRLDFGATFFFVDFIMACMWVLVFCFLCGRLCATLRTRLQRS